MIDDGAEIVAWAPGRVNLIGDHTDYTGGLALPMAIHLGTTVRGRPLPDVVELTSTELGSTVRIPLDVTEPQRVEPPWGRFVAGVITQLRPERGLVGTVESTLPVGSGLSSSAALEVSVALALGADDEPAELAAKCQRAEQLATGVPCGIMDQLAILSGVEGAALMLDCHTCSVEPVALDPSTRVVVVHSGQERSLVGSAYADRRAQCEVAEATIGPLRSAGLADLAGLDDPVLVRRARHVITENARVRAFGAAMSAGDLDAAGTAMLESHASLRDDFDVSTPVLDRLVDRLMATPGIVGARLTGAGFGGCVVALADRPVDVGGWTVRPAAGARRLR